MDMNITETEADELEEMADDNMKREKFVDDVKKSLVKTLTVCLTPKEVARIQREFDKNVRNQEAQSSGDTNDVPSLVNNIVSSQVGKPPPKSESSPIVTINRIGDNFVKPEFMRVNKENPFPFPEPDKKRPKHVSKNVKVFEQTFMRAKHMEKVQKNLERQKRRADRSDKNKKYPGFGEVHNPDNEKMKRKAEKKLEKEMRRMNRAGLLKKANVSKEEKDLMNDLILVAENSDSNSATAVSSVPGDSFIDSSQQPHDLKEQVEANHPPQTLPQTDLTFDASDLISSPVKTQTEEEPIPVPEKLNRVNEMDTINELELQSDPFSSQNFDDDLDALLLEAGYLV